MGFMKAHIAIRAIVIALALAPVALGSLFLAYVALRSPGRPSPFLDANGERLEGSIAEKVFVEINGARQGLFLKGRDVRNPVLLYLHGGMPDYFLTARRPTGLEEAFTVAWWDQRGSGISYDPKVKADAASLARVLDDAVAMTRYLSARFGQERIYLMGHSGGTFSGIQVAAMHPELYHAYLGVAQISDQRQSERLAYEYLLSAYRARGDRRRVALLEGAPIGAGGPLPAAYLALRDTAMHELGVGTTHDMKSLVGGLLLPSLCFEEYTFGEKLGLWLGKARAGVSVVWEEMLERDLSQDLGAFEVPIYFFHGVHDRTCSFDVAKAYYDAIEAPRKGFYVFEASAHSPHFEEPEKFMQIIVGKVLGAGPDAEGGLGPGLVDEAAVPVQRGIGLPRGQAPQP